MTIFPFLYGLLGIELARWTLDDIRRHERCAPCYRAQRPCERPREGVCPRCGSDEVLT